MSLPTTSPHLPGVRGRVPLDCAWPRRGDGRTRSYRGMHLGLDNDCGLYMLRAHQFNAPFSCSCLRSQWFDCRSCGPLRCFRGQKTLIVGIATTAHKDQGEDKTDDHAGDGADDDAN